MVFYQTWGLIFSNGTDTEGLGIRDYVGFRV